MKVELECFCDSPRPCSPLRRAGWRWGWCACGRPSSATRSACPSDPTASASAAQRSPTPSCRWPERVRTHNYRVLGEIGLAKSSCLTACSSSSTTDTLAVKRKYKRMAFEGSPTMNIREYAPIATAWNISIFQDIWKLINKLSQRTKEN